MSRCPPGLSPCLPSQSQAQVRNNRFLCAPNPHTNAGSAPQGGTMQAQRKDLPAKVREAARSGFGACTLALILTRV
jgi:hypothetical protein